MTVYSPDIPKTAEELAFETELKEIITDLAYRYRDAPVDSAEYRFIERQMDGIRRGS